MQSCGVGEVAPRNVLELYNTTPDATWDDVKSLSE